MSWTDIEDAEANDMVARSYQYEVNVSPKEVYAEQCELFPVRHFGNQLKMAAIQQRISMIIGYWFNAPNFFL